MNAKIFELTEKLSNDLINNNIEDFDKHEIIDELKKILPSDCIIVAQTDPTPCDLKGNAQKAFHWIKLAQSLEVNAIIFPELYLVGSPACDSLNKFSVIAEESLEWLNALAMKTIGKTKVIIGFAEQINNSDKYYDSVAVLSNGEVEKIIRKSFLNNVQEDQNSRFFNAGTKTTNNMFKLGNLNVSLCIGDEIEHYQSTNADLIINCVTSISRTGKDELKQKTLSTIAKNLNKPVLYVNQVGSNDSFSYAGISALFNNNGEIIARAKAFFEQFMSVSLSQGGIVYNLPQGMSKDIKEHEAFSLDYEADLERVYQSVVQSIKSYFKKSGFTRAVLGLSGGLDSTVSAVLLVDALGAENVLGISMPSKITSTESKNDAQELAKNLEIPFLEIPIKDMHITTKSIFDSVFNSVEEHWQGRYKTSFTNDNIQARSRAMILWGVANEFGACLPIATSDKSELYMGYATINGDMSGGFAPLADITKTKLFALAKWLNKNRPNKNAIPHSIIEKRPGAELAINPKTGKPLLAEEALMPYEFLDEIIWRVENLKQSKADMINEKFLYEKNYNITPEQKNEWLDKFFKRMSTGIYKWTIMPPFPIIDKKSLNRYEFRPLIVSSKINYQKTTFEEKLESLQ